MSTTSVNVTELRSRLSAYLSRVRGGEEILIRDRNLAVAKLVPLSADFDDELLGLAADGVVRLPDEPLNLESLLAMPSPNISLVTLRAAIEAEREEG
jgi:antitoxin (DNA-binding transcriptional repressor) of toxin-antitoxin stability system